MNSKYVALKDRVAHFYSMQSKKISIRVSDSLGSVSGEVLAATGMKALYVFAHGAGAGMNHPFMTKLSQALAEQGIGSLRYNFPYMENGKKRPDAPAIAQRTVIRAVETAIELFTGIPLLAGGKSFGGRMTSHAASASFDAAVKGLVFVGFPLHAAGQPGTGRAEHLANVKIPMLFLQGTRDALAQIDLIRQVCAKLPAATLREFEGADHSFKAGKQDLIPALADAVAAWSSKVL
ncbi:MAG TPA: alpha/beta family hydrolase [Chryseosolibacter sp.]|nr:alpha/beta family hydrolase [Chryseosolibacter sp.]